MTTSTTTTTPAATSTALVPGGDQAAADYCDELTGWFDRILTTTYTDPVELLDVADKVETTRYEFDDAWEDGSAFEGPLARLAVDRLTLRLRSVDRILADKWTHPAVRANSHDTMARIHHELLGPIAADRREPVVYSITRSSFHVDLCAHIEAHRIPDTIHWTCDPVVDSWVQVTAIAAPLWTYDLYRHLADIKRPLGAVHLAGDPRPLNHINLHVWSPNVPVDDDALDAALALWDPDSGGPYANLAAAISAANLL